MVVFGSAGVFNIIKKGRFEGFFLMSGVRMLHFLMIDEKFKIHLNLPIFCFNMTQIRVDPNS